MATLIDLTKPIFDNPNDPFFMRIKIKHKSHLSSHRLIRFFIGLPKRLFGSTFFGWADDLITNMGVHAATHVDAPFHYAPTVDGKPAKTIDQMPLEWGYGDGLVLDFTFKKENDPITLLEMTRAVAETTIQLVPGMIVLIRTGRDRYVGTKEYPMRGTGVSGEATRWLIEQGIKVMGIDQWGWDLPLKYQAQLAKEKDSDRIFWEGHRVGAELEYFHIEQLVNLDKLPVSGFKLCVFPLPIRNASAAPARVVAILDEKKEIPEM